MTSSDEPAPPPGHEETTSRPRREPPTIEGDPVTTSTTEGAAPAPETDPPAEAAAAPEPARAETTPPGPAPRGGGAGRSLRAILLMGAGAALTAGGAIVWPMLNGPDQASVTTQQDLAALRGRLETLEKKPLPVAATPDQVASLDRRVGTLEQRPAAAPVPQALTDRLNALDARVARAETLAGQAAEMARNAGQAAPASAAGDAASKTSDISASAFDPAPLQAQVQDLAGRLAPLEALLRAPPSGQKAPAEANEATPAAPAFDPAPLEAQIKALADRLGPVEAKLSEPKSEVRATEAPVSPVAPAPVRSPLAEAAGRAVLADTILRSIDLGVPFKAELDAARGLGVDDARLAPLKAVASNGAASLRALASSFDAVASAITSAAAPAAAPSDDQTGIFGQLSKGVSGLVRVRPVGEVEGDDPASIVARIEAALGRGAVDAALGAWEKLPEPAKNVSRDWANSARLRVAAVAGARALLDDAIADIGHGRGAQ